MKRKRISSLSMIILAAGIGFGYGVLMEHYRLFPRSHLQAGLDLIRPTRTDETPKIQNIPMTFTDIKLTSFQVPDLVGLGAIEATIIWN